LVRQPTLHSPAPEADWKLQYWVFGHGSLGQFALEVQLTPVPGATQEPFTPQVWGEAQVRPPLSQRGTAQAPSLVSQKV
jgi:hypothetical protein